MIFIQGEGIHQILYKYIQNIRGAQKPWVWGNPTPWAGIRVLKTVLTRQYHVDNSNWVRLVHSGSV